MDLRALTLTTQILNVECVKRGGIDLLVCGRHLLVNSVCRMKPSHVYSVLLYGQELIVWVEGVSTGG